MKNTFKRIVVCLLTVVLCLGVALFAVACDPDDGGGNDNYIIKVVYPDGTAVTTGTGGPNEDQLQVQMCVDADGGACSVKLAVDANGTVTFAPDALPTLPEGAKYHIVLSGLPEGYTYNATAENLYVNAPGNVTVTLAVAPPQPPQTVAYTLTVKDDNNAPMPGISFEIYTYDTVQYEQSAPIATETTGADGVAVFNIAPSDNANLKYMARLASENGLSYKYEPTRMNWEFNAQKAATATFNYYPNAFTGTATQRINYLRTADVADGEPTETNVPLQLTMNADEYNYFYFNPYDDSVLSREDDDEAADIAAKNLKKARASRGTYNITFAVTGSASVVMKQFAGTLSSMPLDADRVPSQTVTSVDNAGTAIVVEHSESYGSVNYVFGVIANADCTVTVSVERVSDYDYVIPTPVVSTKSPSSTPATVGNSDLQTGTLKAVPTTATVVLGEGGYYHLNAVDGPIVYVVLGKLINYDGVWPYDSFKNVIASIEDPENEDAALIAAAFRFTVATDSKGYATNVDDYKDLVKAYCNATTNDEGLYPLNDDLKTFLTLWANAKSSNAGNANEYLTACKYFGEGSQEDTSLIVGDNSITVPSSEVYSGKIYTFTASNDGWYLLTVEAAKLNDIQIFGESDTVIDKESDKTQYRFHATAGVPVEFAMSWRDTQITSAVSYTVTIATTEAPQASSIDMYGGTVDISLGEFKITNFPGPGKYSLVFTLNGNLSYQAILSVKVGNGTPITVSANTNFMGVITVTEADIDNGTVTVTVNGYEDTAAIVGNIMECISDGANTISLTTDDLMGKDYEVRVSQSGWYMLSVDGSQEYVQIFAPGGFDALIAPAEDKLSYVFYVEAYTDDPVVLSMAWGNDATDPVSYTVTLAPTEAPDPSTISLNDEIPFSNKHGGAVNFGLGSFNITDMTEGTYSIGINVGGTSYYGNTFTIKIGNGDPVEISTANNYLADITITAEDIQSGVVTVTIVNGVNAELTVTLEKKA